jgi:hypothetical protein
MRFHVMTRELRAGTNQVCLASPPHFHCVVGDEPVSPDHEVEGALALPDAAVTRDEHAKAEDIHQHAMNHLSYGKQTLEHAADSGDGGRCRDRRPQQRHMEALARGHQLRRRRPAPRDQHAWNVVGERRCQHVQQRVAVERVQVADLALAKHEYPARLEVLVKSGEGEPRLLYVRTGDRACGALLPTQQFERQADRVGPALQQTSDGELGLHSG